MAEYLKVRRSVGKNDSAQLVHLRLIGKEGAFCVFCLNARRSLPCKAEEK